MPSPVDRLISTDVELALDRLRRGGIVAVPTETVYGLAADAEQSAAVARVYAAKGRPTDHPLIVHVSGADAIDGWVADFPEGAAQLAAACWPGPLTLLLVRGPRVTDQITGGRDTVGVRVPSHPLTLDLLARHGGGLAAPSANRYGKVSPTTAQHVLDDLSAHLDREHDLILDGGPCEIGVESTIVDVTVDPPQVLRAGAISTADVEQILSGPTAGVAGPSRAAGMVVSHYAPDCQIVPVVDPIEAEAVAAIRRTQGQRVGVLDRNDDLVVAAQLLYSDLRAADQAGLDTLVVVLPPAHGIGHALRDRLFKASAG